MYSKCYSIITDFFGGYVAEDAPFDEKWRVLRNLGDGWYLMVRHTSEVVKFAPLHIHSFPLLAPHHLLESEKFNIRFTDPSEITEIADKLRWYRYRKALLQRKVADNMYERSELDYLIYNAPLEYADLILNGGRE